MVFFFKQKTAYEMRISDWSSDVCSSDLLCTLLRDSENGTKTNRAAIGKLLAASKWTEQFRTFSERFAPSLEGIRLAAERTRLLDMTILRASADVVAKSTVAIVAEQVREAHGLIDAIGQADSNTQRHIGKASCRANV